MKKIKFILLFVLPFTVYSQSTFKNNYYKSQFSSPVKYELSNKSIDQSSNTFMILTDSDNMLAIVNSDTGNSSTHSDTTKSHFLGFSIGLDWWYFSPQYIIPMFSVELSNRLSENMMHSIQFSSIILLNDLAYRFIYKPSNEYGFYYGAGVHKPFFGTTIGTTTRLGINGIVGYEWLIFWETRIGGEFSIGPIWSKHDNRYTQERTLPILGLRVRW